MFKKIFWLSIAFAAFGLFVFLPFSGRADAPPPPPFTVYVDYGEQPVGDETFYAALLTCQTADEEDRGFLEYYQDLAKISPEYQALTKLNTSETDATNDCAWRPSYLPYYENCANGLCRFDRVLGEFKVAVYLPEEDQTFTSDKIDREYLGYYGRDTAEYYLVQLSEDGNAALSETLEREDQDSDAEETASASEVFLGPFNLSVFGPLLTGSLLITLILELIVALIFILIKKRPKKILWGVVIGNIVSVPLLWLAVASFYWALWPAEIAVVVFEAWLIKRFSRGKLSWESCLFLGLLMNLISFIAGPIIYY